MTKWTSDHIPNQTGRVAVVTGASSGIGLQIAALLASKGAKVVLAVRDQGRGEAAMNKIVAEFPKAQLELSQLDLTSLQSIRSAATQLNDTHPHIELLINNAGVMFTPLRRTSDGFELQFGTNHLGHFAFTGLLIDNLLATAGSRVVTMSSHAHKNRPDIDFNDLHAQRGYDRVAAYGRSKVANLLFTYELNRRLATSGTPLALAAHPGFTQSNLGRDAPALIRYGWPTVGRLILQSARMGALPALRAATDPTARSGQYYGPSGFGEYRGHPKVVTSSPMSHDEALARRLWTVSEDATGVSYPI